MLDKTPEELEEEFKEKIEEIQIQLEDVADHEFSAEIIQALGLEDEVLDSGEEKRGFKVHWVLPTDISLNTCDNIETTYDAQRAFAEYSFNKNNKNESPVSPGDILILTCNHSTIVDEKDESDEPTGESYFTDACYFVGMCISTEALKVQNLELHQEAMITAFEGTQGEAGRQFIAWSTCMGEGEDCPEDPDTIKIDEIVIPEDSSGDDVSCLTYTSSGSTLTAKLNELKSLALSKGEELSSMETKGLIIKGDTSTSVGLHTYFDNLRDSITDYDISGYTDKVSLFSQSAILQEASFKAKTLRSQGVSISSDSCGNLLKTELGSEESKELSILASSGDSGSSIAISAVDIQKQSDVSVSLGKWELTQLALGEQYNNDKYFIPKITNSDFIKIQNTVTVPVASNMTLEKTASSESEGDCTYNTITITPKWYERTLTFKSGVLVEMSDNTQKTGAAVTFNCAVCNEEPPTYGCNGCPSPLATDLPATQIKRYQLDQYFDPDDPESADDFITDEHGSYYVYYGTTANYGPLMDPYDGTGACWLERNDVTGAGGGSNMHVHTSTVNGICTKTLQLPHWVNLSSIDITNTPFNWNAPYQPNPGYIYIFS